MQLVLTSYLDRSPDDIEDLVSAAVPSALRAAADRIDAIAHTPHAEAHPNGVVLRGVDILDGAELSWDGDDGLTTIRVLVPWASADSASGHKLLAAHRFTQVFSAASDAAA